MIGGGDDHAVCTDVCCPGDPADHRAGEAQAVRQARDCKGGRGGGTGVELVSILIMLGCAADGIYTLIHISRGAVELNPFMDLLLDYNAYAFFLVKYFLTACCVFILIFLIHHPVGRAILGSVAVLYGLIVTYQLYLYFF